MTTIRAEFRLTDWNDQTIRARVPAILGAYADRLGTQFKEEIRAAQYDWPRETRRRNGSTAGSPRDIVDTGAFLRSQVRRRDSPTQIRFIWGNSSVTYAGYILNGIPERNYPPRDWITPALEKHPMDRFFSQYWSGLSSLSRQ